MNLIKNETALLWSGFMPMQNKIANRIGRELFSIQNYPANYYSAFKAETVFEKWACVQVDEHTSVTNGLEEIVIPQGKYAVFQFKGNPQNPVPFFTEVFTKTLPEAGLTVDERPHFEILGDKFKKDSDSSEEEIWIPVK